jgi:hypothetical protein
MWRTGLYSVPCGHRVQGIIAGHHVVYGTSDARRGVGRPCGERLQDHPLIYFMLRPNNKKNCKQQTVSERKLRWRDFRRV